MDVQFKGTINAEEEARSYMKLAVTTESKDRLKYYLDLLDYGITLPKGTIEKIIGDQLSFADDPVEIC